MLHVSPSLAFTDDFSSPLKKRDKDNIENPSRNHTGDVYTNLLVSQMEPLQEGMIDELREKTNKLNIEWKQATTNYKDLKKSVDTLDALEKEEDYKKQFLLSSESNSMSDSYKTITQKIKTKEEVADLKMQWQKDAVQMGDKYSNIILLGIVFVFTVIIFMIVYLL
jgi:hypothetical protein